MKRQRPIGLFLAVTAGVTAEVILCIEPVHIGARLRFRQGDGGSTKERRAEAQLLAPRLPIVGGSLIEVILLGVQLVIAVLEDLAGLQVAQQIRRTDDRVVGNVLHALHQLGCLVQVCAALVALSVLVLVCVDARVGIKPHRHIVVGEVGGLGEAVAVVTGAGDIELHLGDGAQAGQIELRPIRNDILRAVAQIDGRFAGLRFPIVAGGCQLDPVIIADFGGQAVAVQVAVQRVADVVDIHVVDHARHAVAKGQGRQDLTVRVAGVVLVAEVYGKVVGAVVSAAGADIALGARFVHCQLVIEVAIGNIITGSIVGHGMTAAPIAVIIPALGHRMLQLGVPGIVPGVRLAIVRGAAAVGVQHAAAVLRAVDQARPVALAGKIGAALIVGILKCQHPQLIACILRLPGRGIGRLCPLGEGGDHGAVDQRQRHHQRHQRGDDTFLDVHFSVLHLLFLFLLFLKSKALRQKAHFRAPAVRPGMQSTHAWPQSFRLSASRYRQEPKDIPKRI